MLPGDDLYGRPDEVLDRFAECATRDAEAQERTGLGDLRVDTSGRSAADVARLVRVGAGDWPG